MPDGLTNQILNTIPLFKEMNKSTLELIAAKSHFVDLEKGAFLYHKGDQCTGFYITIQGNIKVSFISRDGKEHVVRIIGPGQSFGEAMMFTEKPYPATVQSITPAKVLFIPKALLFQCMEEDAGCVRGMLAGLSRRVQQLLTRLESLTLDSSQQRVIGYLLQHLDPSTTKNGKRDIELQANKATIALHLNLAPETLSRVLHELCENGLIRVEGKVIHVLDIEKMRNFY